MKLQEVVFGSRFRLKDRPDNQAEYTLLYPPSRFKDYMPVLRDGFMVAYLHMHVEVEVIHQLTEEQALMVINGRLVQPGEIV